jgi:Cu(I)/Ag(I) efflux system membrane fusion protein/cobalt-zinc-cadmium efflux system membrane fusion protein
MGQQSSLAIDFTTNPNPVHKGSNAVTVKVTDANGQPVVGAQVTATFLLPAMPAMGMGPVTNNFQLTQKSPGVYDGTAVLESGGTWQVTVTIKQGAQVVGTKQLHVRAEGGM